jgi:hypothetical protein
MDTTKPKDASGRPIPAWKNRRAAGALGISKHQRDACPGSSSSAAALIALSLLGRFATTRRRTASVASLSWLCAPVTRLCRSISLFLPSSSGWRMGMGAVSSVYGARHLPARCSRSSRRTACSSTSPMSRAPWPEEQVSRTPQSSACFMYALPIRRFILCALHFSAHSSA